MSTTRVLRQLFAIHRKAHGNDQQDLDGHCQSEGRGCRMTHKENPDDPMKCSKTDPRCWFLHPDFGSALSSVDGAKPDSERVHYPGQSPWRSLGPRQRGGVMGEGDLSPFTPERILVGCTLHACRNKKSGRRIQSSSSIDNRLAM